MIFSIDGPLLLIVDSVFDGILTVILTRLIYWRKWWLLISDVLILILVLMTIVVDDLTHWPVFDGIVVESGVPTLSHSTMMLLLMLTIQFILTIVDRFRPRWWLKSFDVVDGIHSFCWCWLDCYYSIDYSIQWLEMLIWWKYCCWPSDRVDRWPDDDWPIRLKHYCCWLTLLCWPFWVMTLLMILFWPIAQVFWPIDLLLMYWRWLLFGGIHSMTLTCYSVLILTFDCYLMMLLTIHDDYWWYCYCYSMTLSVLLEIFYSLLLLLMTWWSYWYWYWYYCYCVSVEIDDIVGIWGTPWDGRPSIPSIDIDIEIVVMIVDYWYSIGIRRLMTDIQWWLMLLLMVLTDDQRPSTYIVDDLLMWPFLTIQWPPIVYSVIDW